jgi:hypothetical protein
VRRLPLLILLGACRLGFDPVVGQGNSDGGVARCSLATDLGDLGAPMPVRASRYRETIKTGDIYQLSATLPADTTARLKIELWDGYGAFAGGIAHTGTFQLGGADASAATCGICAYVTRGSSESPSSYVALLALAGTIDVTQLAGVGGTVMANATNLELAQIDPATSAPTTDGCTTVVKSASLTGTLMSSQGGVGTIGGHGGDGASTGDGGD